MNKYQAGDKVRVRSDLRAGSYYAMAGGRRKDIVTHGMELYAGEVVTIAKNPWRGDGIYFDSSDEYLIEEMENSAFFTDEMFEGKLSDGAEIREKIKDELHITIKRNGDKVTARAENYDGIKGTAKCHKLDDFDLSVGASLAVERLIAKCDAWEAEKHGYNAKVICISSNIASWHFTEGRIYEIIDGKLISDLGVSFSVGSFKDLEKNPNVKFIELVEGRESSSEYFNGKVVCISAHAGMTLGKIYEFKNGLSIADNGLLFPGATGPIKSVEELNSVMFSQYIEVKE